MDDESTRSRQAVAAEEQRGVRFERDLLDVDEIGIAGLVRLRADVAIHLIAARVLHRVELRQLARVFALADGRVIARDLLDAAGTQLVQPACPRRGRPPRGRPRSRRP